MSSCLYGALISTTVKVCVVYYTYILDLVCTESDNNFLVENLKADLIRCFDVSCSSFWWVNLLNVPAGLPGRDRLDRGLQIRNEAPALEVFPGLFWHRRRR